MAKKYYMTRAATNTNTRNLEFGKTKKFVLLFKNGEMTSANARADVLEELTKKAIEVDKAVFKMLGTGKPELIIEE